MDTQDERPSSLEAVSRARTGQPQVKGADGSSSCGCGVMAGGKQVECGSAPNPEDTFLGEEWAPRNHPWALEGSLSARE